MKNVKVYKQRTFDFYFFTKTYKKRLVEGKHYKIQDYTAKYNDLIILKAPLKKK